MEEPSIPDLGQGITFERNTRACYPVQYFMHNFVITSLQFIAIQNGFLKQISTTRLKPAHLLAATGP